MRAQREAKHLPWSHYEKRRTQDNPVERLMKDIVKITLTSWSRYQWQLLRNATHMVKIVTLMHSYSPIREVIRIRQNVIWYGFKNNPRGEDGFTPRYASTPMQIIIKLIQASYRNGSSVVILFMSKYQFVTMEGPVTVNCNAEARET